MPQALRLQIHSATPHHILRNVDSEGGMNSVSLLRYLPSPRCTFLVTSQKHSLGLQADLQNEI